jgi:putative hemolysin
MNLSGQTLFAVIPPLLLLEGLFSGSEIALLSADKFLLQAESKKGSTGARLALDLARHPERILSTTLLMTSLCVIGISALIELWLLGSGQEHSEILGILITSPLIVIFGELIPKTVFQGRAQSVSTWVAWPITAAYYLLFPITRLLGAYTSRVSKIVSPIEDLLGTRRKSVREEIRSMLTWNRKETELKSSERRMIRRIFDFRETEAKHTLIPLVRVEAIEQGATIREALERFRKHRHSRMPVYQERIDNIVGVLEVSDLFHVTDIELSIRGYVGSAHYAAESQPLEDLIRDMTREDTELAVVVDEYGGAIGILTLEDIIEEIVGEIDDEYDTRSAPVQPIGENSWLVPARTPIAVIQDSIPIVLPEGDYETLGGFLLQQFGRIPEAGDELYFSTSQGQFKFTIRKASPRHIDNVRIDLLMDTTAQDQEIDVESEPDLERE